MQSIEIKMENSAKQNFKNNYRIARQSRTINGSSVLSRNASNELESMGFTRQLLLSSLYPKPNQKESYNLGFRMALYSKPNINKTKRSIVIFGRSIPLFNY